MPEGHVIHRLAAHLNERFRGGPLAISSPQGRFDATLIDASSLALAEAHGKHLFLTFSGGEIVYIHLGLIGSLRFEPAEDVWGQIRLRLVAGETAANLRGPQFCRYVSPAEMQGILDRTGEDPLREDASPDALFSRVQASTRAIGSLMMDQKLFAGVGNIYRAEALFRQGVSPFLPGRELSREEFFVLWDDLVLLMRYGFEHGRIDTVREQHTPEAMGRPPRKDDHGGEVYVYRRAGEPCFVCGTPVAVRKVEGRNLFWCPGCQG
ncbi:Fpg/Nei family DNA glycosylase [Corynebacterium liangguodongii]|uniref:DNA-(apurinic or apyrimidinic site) lyase n=1 Tax=Corynebacterium liangguodongii TaxID=2079535 RepID=A0A2S0WGV7_9CORY|nr:DNA-formamidopyrimidine glycosylase family protein [Corynebacterium liangguodongii]AWB84912.1 DNA glycosylase [Corynebacterium liangguodongii]PWB99380.1 Fpg/Nei family DNA glycosylase [Corynebacterium liangguodongii]